MLRESPEFAPFLRSARIDAYNDMRAATRQARISVPGQIRLEPRRSGQEAAAAARGAPEAPRPTGSIIRGKKREHVVEQIAQTLQKSKLSPFEFEGACRHGIRAELCLEGHKWHAADAEADVLVAESLNRINAERPSYSEGQREHTIHRDYCAWCGSPMDEHGQPGTNMSFCSADCAKSAIAHRQLNYHRQETKAFDEAYKVIMRSRNPACDCAECGKTFRPLEVGAQYCSKTCASRARVKQLGLTPAGHALLSPRECRHCGDTFHPTDAKSVYCSTGCKNEGRRIYRHDIECQHCRKQFRPTNSTNKFCSRECWEAHDRPREHRCNCEWCGEAFLAAEPGARFCGRRCLLVSYRFNLGSVPTRLSSIVFDHFVTVPASGWVPPPHLENLMTPRRGDPSRKKTQ